MHVNRDFILFYNYVNSFIMCEGVYGNSDFDNGQWAINCFLQVPPFAAKEDDYTLSCDAKSSCAFHMIGFLFLLSHFHFCRLFVVNTRFTVFFLFSLWGL